MILAMRVFVALRMLLIALTIYDLLDKKVELEVLVVASGGSLGPLVLWLEFVAMPVECFLPTLVAGVYSHLWVDPVSETMFPVCQTLRSKIVECVEVAHNREVVVP